MKKLIFLAAICLTAILAGSCEGKADMEPDVVVTEFYTSLTSMNFDKAAEFCVEESSATAYINEYRQVYETSLKRDEKVTNAAAEKAAGCTVSITEVVKNDDSRTVLFTISDVYGSTKEKEARLEKVEKAWKIAEIKDKQ